MKSTGEVMGVDSNFGLAFAKSQIAANGLLPMGGTAFLSVRDRDKLPVTALATRLVALGFRLMATAGTAEVITRAGVPVERVYKVTEGMRPHIVDRMKNGEIAMVVNTPEGRSARHDSYSIRRTAVTMGIPHFTTMAAAEATADAVGALRKQSMTIRSLQEYHAAV
jgi:carbamoyl-phosphate synthase large subunit